MIKKLSLICTISLTITSFMACSNSESESLKPEQDSAAIEKNQTDNQNQDKNMKQDQKKVSKALHVKGSHLLDENNEPIVLQGSSTFGLNYMPETVNENMFEFLREEMDSEVIRLAMYTAGDNGYCTGGDQNALKSLIHKGVKLAMVTDQYAVIDWHILSDGNPLTYVEESKKFFDEMSAVYAGNPGVIYEICNEPNGNITWQDVKEYAEQVIPVIQKNDPDALILVGTPQWSQKETEAAADPLDLHGNIMITVHFYAATHGQDLLDQMNQAYELGVPVFVSEFGISEASGNGRLDSDMADQWFESMNKDKISRIAWAVSNKDESSAMFKPDTDLTNPDLEDLSEYGKWLHQTYAKDARLKEFQSSKDLKDVDHMDKKTGDDKDNGIESDVFSDEEEVTDESELEVSIHEKKSWEKDDRIYTQYELELKNPTSKTVSDWKETIRFSKSFTIDQSWNAVFTINDNELIIKPVDWNSKIEPNQKMEDIGFILASDSKLNLRLR